jgi:Outer membrane protein beta-barrel domain
MELIMRRFASAVFCVCLFFGLASNVHAQDDDYGDKINTNLGVIVTVPVGSTSSVVSTSPGIVAGVGYNFSRRHSFIGEFMWNGLFTSGGAINPIRAGVQDNTITGHSNLYAVTGNYRFQIQRRIVGVYFIGGGGWYYRTAGLSTTVTPGPNIPCATAWGWWGYKCASGTVIPGQTVRGFNSSALGGNAGIGFTVKVSEPSYRVYVESRYHYAPTKNVSTQVLDITIGIRY